MTQPLLSTHRVVVLSACGLLGCENDPSFARPTEEPPAAQMTTGSPEPDEWVRFEISTPFDGPSFPEHCVSKASDGSVLSASPLPVGNGRWLECTVTSPREMNRLVPDQQGVEWCLRGRLLKYTTAGEKPLMVDVLSQPTTGPWTLRATSPSPSSVTKAGGFGGSMWPLWIVGVYEVIRYEPTAGRVCLSEPGRPVMFE
jgi:hypothetical protein